MLYQAQDYEYKELLGSKWYGLHTSGFLSELLHGTAPANKVIKLVMQWY